MIKKDIPGSVFENKAEKSPRLWQLGREKCRPAGTGITNSRSENKQGRAIAVAEGPGIGERAAIVASGIDGPLFVKMAANVRPEFFQLEADRIPRDL